MKKLVGLISAALTLFSFSSSAQVLLSWEFSGDAGSELGPLAADFSDSNISSGTLTRGSGISASGNANSFNANSWSDIDDGIVTDLPGAFGAGDFFSFSIAPNTGFSIDMSGIDINFVTTGTGPNSFGLFSSLDSFATSIDTFSLDGTSGSINLDVSGSSFDTITSTVEFRLAGFGATSGSGGARFEGSGNDIVFSGVTSAIPEPSTYALIFGGLALGVVVWKRRRAVQAE